MLRFTQSFVTKTVRTTPSAYIPKRNFFGTKEEPTPETPKEETTQSSTATQEATAALEAKYTAEIEAQKQKLAEMTKEISELKSHIHRQELGTKELNNKMKELQERVLTEINEQDNIRERGRKEVESVKVFGVSSFCKKLLEVCDTLDMAMNATNQSLAKTDNEEVHRIGEGIKMTQKVFEKVLAEQGVEKFNSIGEKVNPNLHDVSAQLPDPSKEAGTISFVIKEGYTIKDRVLRPAQVVAVMEQ